MVKNQPIRLGFNGRRKPRRRRFRISPRFNRFLSFNPLIGGIRASRAALLGQRKEARAQRKRALIGAATIASFTPFGRVAGITRTIGARVSRGIAKAAGRITGVSPVSPTRLAVSGLVGGAALTSPLFRKGLVDIPRTVVGAGKKIGEAIEAGGITPSGFSPLSLLGAGALGALGIGGAAAAVGALRRRRPQDITITQVPPIFQGQPQLQELPTPGLGAVQPFDAVPGAVTVEKPKPRAKRKRKVLKAPMVTNIIQNQVSVRHG